MEIIKPQSCISFNISKGRLLKIIDISGGQVADLFAINSEDNTEFISTSVTIDCNRKLFMSSGDILYSNIYRPLFEIIVDTVGIHDLLHPCCRKEMYETFYKGRKDHPNCLDNINRELTKISQSQLTEIRPVNVFMYTQIANDGSIIIKKPATKPGDFIVLKPLINEATIFLASCSVDSGECNGGQCSAIGYEVI